MSGRQLGLGLDAGGTYTDGALVDFGTGRVIGKAKAPTRHDDLPRSVDEVLAQLPPSELARVGLVSLSTTHATNALVEGRGATVGLLLMPPNQPLAERVDWQPRRVVPGRQTIEGIELEPVDQRATRSAVDELLAEGVEAFAVSGYASVVNPVHERAVADAAAEHSGLPVVAGHELTGQLDFVRRAHTAALNSRLLPIIGRLFEAVAAVLVRHDITAPIYVMRGDGSLLALAAARDRPIETVLSGPAASVVGAHYLTGLDDSLVLDIGGTTADVAVIAGGAVAVTDEGATVGPWRTSVRAASIMVSGLGGDSLVQWLDGGLRLQVGPQRAEPICVTAAEHQAVADELRGLVESKDDDPLPPAHLEWFRLAGPRPRNQLAARQEQLLEELARGPMSRLALRTALNCPAPQLVPTQTLEAAGTIRRCAFTPTDALHVLGIDRRWNAKAAGLCARALGEFCGRTPEGLAAWVVDSLEASLAKLLIRRELADTLVDPASDSHPAMEALLAELARSRVAPRPEYQLAFTAKRAVIGLGAPAAAFVPAVAARLDTTAVVPEHAEVANAVGAATARVVARAEVRLLPTSRGTYVLASNLGHGEFDSLDGARAEAERLLAMALRQRGLAFGAEQREVDISVRERLAPVADGGFELVEVLLEGVLVGRPLA